MTLSNTTHEFLLRWSGTALFLVLWEIAPRLGWIDPYFLPPFSVVLAEIWRLFLEDHLAIHIIVSMWRAVTGLLLALLLGVPLGFVLGHRLVGTAAVLQPVLVALSQVNPFSLMPLFALFLGIGEVAKICIIGWVSLWPIMFYTITATRTVDPLLLKTGASMGISRQGLLFKVIAPAALPTLFTGIRVSAGFTFFILIASEMLGGRSGLGFLVHNSAMNYQVARIYAGATFIVLLGYLLNRSLSSLERHLFSRRKTRETAAAAVIAGAVPEWRPVRKRVVAVVTVVLITSLMVIGGHVARQTLTEAVPAVEGKHSRHLGQPVNE